MRHEKRFCYIALPTYERHENETMAAAYRHCIPDDDPDYSFHNHPSKGCSLLAKAFNDHWVDCLDNYPDTTYWVLLHGDVEPCHLWLHTLIEEMETYKLDVIHACIALKDNRAATSTGIGPIMTEWSATRKVMISELAQLPETFTVEDCLTHLDWSGDNIFSGLLQRNPIDLCMLPNTGCLVVKVDDWCWTYPGWVIKDRLAVIREDGTADLPKRVECHWPQHFRIPFKGRNVKHQVHVIPEDWNFGRWCAREGLRVGACSKVTTKHWGNASFPCDRNAKWGEQRDEWFWNCKERM